MFRLWQTLALLIFTARAFPENRIVNGANAKPGEIPYIVSLRLDDLSHFCGGTIINEYWILTAAHCVYGLTPTIITIQYGVTRVSSDGVNTLPVEKLIPHPNFGSENGFLDNVAVVKLQQPIKFSEFAQPVGLPPAFNATPGGAVAVAAGWGMLEDDYEAEFSDDLQRVDLDVYTDENCERVSSNETNRRHHICAGKHGKGVCVGDFGGPLVVNGTQIGISSDIMQSCGGMYPGVFTKVSSYVEWIYENISE